MLGLMWRSQHSGALAVVFGVALALGVALLVLVPS